VVGEDNVVEAVRDLTGGFGVDLVVDTSGGRGTISQAIDLVRRGGQIGIVGLAAEAPFDPSTIAHKEVTIFGSFRRQPSTWYRSIKLVADRAIDVRPLITHSYPVAEAEEAFEVLVSREGIKAIITPS
jgi:threonine dehydrogenase-like Zn-dependent dehydrogenase